MINGGCLNGDRIINGGCVDMGSYYEADWICTIDGKMQFVNAGEKCYKEYFTNPSSFYCKNNEILNGTTCINREIEKPTKEKYCPDGYTLVNHDKCINYNKTKSKENGFVCDSENTKLSGNECIIYEIVPAKEN
jgi:hypothetical protein